MEWSIWVWLGVVGGGLVVFFLGQLVYLSAVLVWEDQRTRGVGYYGLSPAERMRFRRRLRLHARLLYPILRLLGWFSTLKLDNASFRFRDVAGPKGTCSEESFRAGAEYVPRAEDVFVVTQMKCGTTWMQHVVYQVLRRGAGDLVETGTALYAVSPWLEALKSVPVAEAPEVGEERPARIIKTHFPVALCPWSPQARYIYVARHPVSCFASCRDFLAANTGAMAPDLETVREWYCSDHMWWGPWPDHVAGWWKRSEEQPQILFVTFEEMKADLPSVIGRVAAFLGVAPLTEGELADVGRKCSFAYMQEHSEAFEMHPPHILAIDAELFVSGRTERHRDVPEALGREIFDWAAQRLRELGASMDRFYQS